MNSSHALSATGIRVRTRSFDIVRDVSFHLAEGEILALMGPNGAGKTTLVKAVLGLIAAQGSVSVAGRALSDAASRARHLAYVPQQSRLIAALSAREVVELGRFPHRGSRLGLSADDTRVVDRALQQTDCSYLEQRRFDQCSGGEQARLLLARALATEAPVLFLDEPAASLDIAHRLQLYALLRRLADGGHSILVVMHHIDDALQWADRCVLMDSGRICASGSVAEVLDGPTVAQVYGVEMLPGAAVGFRLRGDQS